MNIFNSHQSFTIAAEERYTEWLVTVVKNNGGTTSSRFQPNFQHCLICLKIEQNAAE